MILDRVSSLPVLRVIVQVRCGVILWRGWLAHAFEFGVWSEAQEQRLRSWEPENALRGSVTSVGA